MGADARRPGTLYAGPETTASLQVEGGKASVLYDAPELRCTRWPWRPDCKLYVGTSPEGKVYAVVTASGKAETFYDPTDKYIWALAFDRNGHLVVASGAEGRIVRVDREGKAQTLLTSAETHITALLVDARSGFVYAGSSPGGILYRIDPTGKVFVLHDSPFREVKALLLGATAASTRGDRRQGRRTRAPTDPVMPPCLRAVRGVTVTESFTVVRPRARRPCRPADAPAGAAAGGHGMARSCAWPPVAKWHAVWSDSDETPYAIPPSADGILSHGREGRRLPRPRRPDMDDGRVLSGEQVTALQPELDGSSCGHVQPRQAARACRARGAGARSCRSPRHGHGVELGPLALGSPAAKEPRSRSRRVAQHRTPDSTWSDWSAAHRRADGEAVTSERARFLQLKVTLAGRDGRSPILDSVSAAYLQRNLRPQLQTITVHPPGEVFQKPLSLTGEAEILGLETGPRARGGRRPGRAAAEHAPHPPATAGSSTERHPDVLLASRRRQRGHPLLRTCPTAPWTTPVSAPCARPPGPGPAWDTPPSRTGRWCGGGGAGT